MIPFVAASTAGAGAFLVGRILRRADRRAAGLAGWRWERRPAPPPWFVAAVADADLSHDPAAAWVTLVVAAPVAVVVAAVAAGPGLAVAVLLVVAVGPALGLLARRGAAGRRVDADLPEALDAVARSLRTGATLPQAVAEVAPATRGRLARDLGDVIRRAAGGQPFVGCLDDWPRRCPTPGVRLAAAALGLAADAGGAAAEAVDGVAATMRAELALAGEIRAQSSQARLSALVIAVSPLAFGVFAAGTDPRTARFLLHTSLGAVCIVTALLLDAAAAWWMHRITVSPS